MSRRLQPPGLLTLVLVTLALGVTFATPAAAHVKETTGYSTVSDGGGRVQWRLSVDYVALVKAAALGEQALTATTDEARATALRHGHADAERYLADRMAVSADGAACEPRLDWTGVSHRDRVPFADMTLVFTCGEEQPGAYALHYDVFRGTDGVTDDHENIVEYTLAGRTGRTVFDRQATDHVTGETSWVNAGRQFVAIGFHHILAGADHILFVLLLVIGASRARRLVWTVSTFTLAHSLTIALAAIGWVGLPASIVQPLIALSIAYVAFDTLLSDRDHERPRLHLTAVFACGLLHGLGFAGALQLPGSELGPFLFSLFTFNLGIELGQACSLP